MLRVELGFPRLDLEPAESLEGKPSVYMIVSRKDRNGRQYCNFLVADDASSALDLAHQLPGVAIVEQVVHVAHVTAFSRAFGPGVV